MEQQPGDSAMVKVWGKGHDRHETLTEDRSQPPLPPGLLLSKRVCCHMEDPELWIR